MTRNHFIVTTISYDECATVEVKYNSAYQVCLINFNSAFKRKCRSLCIIAKLVVISLSIISRQISKRVKEMNTKLIEWFEQL